MQYKSFLETKKIKLLVDYFYTRYYNVDQSNISNYAQDDEYQQKTLASGKHNFFLKKPFFITIFYVNIYSIHLDVSFRMYLFAKKKFPLYHKNGQTQASTRQLYLLDKFCFETQILHFGEKILQRESTNGLCSAQFASAKPTRGLCIAQFPCQQEDCALHSFFIKNGYPKNGYQKMGYPKNGYPKNGYPKNGYQKNGYPKNGYPKNGYLKNGYPKNGYPKNGYPKNGYPKMDIQKWISKKWISKNGISKKWISKNGISKNGISKNGISKNGISKNGISKNGISKNGISKNGISKNGRSKNGISKVWKICPNLLCLIINQISNLAQIHNLRCYRDLTKNSSSVLSLKLQFISVKVLVQLTYVSITQPKSRFKLNFKLHLI
ncbi:hypothetical protein pb186bvf_005870 [Paramecium bursaria]